MARGHQLSLGMRARAHALDITQCGLEPQLSSWVGCVGGSRERTGLLQASMLSLLEWVGEYYDLSGGYVGLLYIVHKMPSQKGPSIRSLFFTPPVKFLVQ